MEGGDRMSREPLMSFRLNNDNSNSRSLRDDNKKNRQQQRQMQQLIPAG
jgi:hypothetical protein